MLSRSASHKSTASHSNDQQPDLKTKPIGPLTGHQPKTDFETKHKVITFGEQYVAETREEQQLYSFRHQKANLVVTEGNIPVGFLSTLWLEEGYPLFLETRAGVWEDKEEPPPGPEYSVSWKPEREPVPPAGLDGNNWMRNLDQLWINVISHFERRNILSEDSLDFLDADPFVLFGIDSRVTQQALIKMQRFPALMCESVQPSLKEWSQYMRIPQDEECCRWLVEAMAETELPKPWTCYKGAGSIVCFLRSDNGAITWKHPFYDYFRQMREYCRQAKKEEIMQMRITRLMWSYEGTRVETEHYQEPLISPECVAALGKIFGFDLRVEGCVVRNLKGCLKTFAKQWRDVCEIDINDVVLADEVLHKDSAKYQEMKAEWSDENHSFELQLKTMIGGKIQCCNCSAIALAFCLECKDYLCLECYDTLHQKGQRRQHAPFRLVSCSYCLEMPARLHCSFTDKSTCHECYALKHVPVLPPDGKENPPRRIEYDKQYIRYATFAKERRENFVQRLKEQREEEGEDRYESVLSTDWHPFYDSRGVKYFHNFFTGERMRQSPRTVPNSADPEASEDRNVKYLHDRHFDDEEPEATAEPDTRPPPIALTGYDKLSTGPKAQVLAAAEPENRNPNIIPPYRIHMPNEVPQP